MVNTAKDTTHVRVDRAFARYLEARATREHCSVVELSRRIIRAILNHQKGAWS